jgi:hypothetical protein
LGVRGTEDDVLQQTVAFAGFRGGQRKDLDVIEGVNTPRLDVVDGLFAGNLLRGHVDGTLDARYSWPLDAMFRRRGIGALGCFGEVFALDAFKDITTP